MIPSFYSPNSYQSFPFFGKITDYCFYNGFLQVVLNRYTGGHRRTSQKSGSCNCFVCLLFGTSSEHVAMDCIINVVKEVDNVIGKFSSVQDKTDQILMDLITNLQKLQRDLIFLSSKYLFYFFDI